MKTPVDVVGVVRKLIARAPAAEHSIPNSDVRLLLLEIDRLGKLLTGPIWNDHSMVFPRHH